MSSYAVEWSFERSSISTAATLAAAPAPDVTTTDLTSLNSKSIAQTEVLVGVVTKFVSNVITWLVASNAVINFGDSVEPEPEVISDFESSVEPEIFDKSEPEINSKKQK